METDPQNPKNYVWQAQPHGDHSKFKNTSAYCYSPFSEKAMSTIISALQKCPNSSGLVQLDAYGVNTKIATIDGKS